LILVVDVATDPTPGRWYVSAPLHNTGLVLTILHQSNYLFNLIILVVLILVGVLILVLVFILVLIVVGILILVLILVVLIMAAVLILVLIFILVLILVVVLILILALIRELLLLSLLLLDQCWLIYVASCHVGGAVVELSMLFSRCDLADDLTTLSLEKGHVPDAAPNFITTASFRNAVWKIGGTSTSEIDDTEKKSPLE